MSDVEGWAGRATVLSIAGENVAVVDLPATDDVWGPPLLVLHGFPTSSVDFAAVADDLARHRRVVFVDLPGYGLSDKPDRAYSLFGQADVVAAVAARLGLDEVDLLTHDMGDSVGGELLARSIAGVLAFGVRRRVLTNGSIYLALARLTSGQQLLRQLPDAVLPDSIGMDRTALTDAMVELCADDLREDEEVRDRLDAGSALVMREAGNRLLPRLIRYIDERAEHEDRWTGAIEDHPAPLTVVWGRQDPIAVADMADKLAARRPDTTLVWLDAGHWPMLERPATFTAAVIDALDR